MNEQNLIPAAHKLTVEEQSKGGKESVKSRLRKKNTKQKLQLLLSLPCHDDCFHDIAALGIDYDEIDNEMAMLVALYKKARSGDVQAVRAVYSNLGKDHAAAELAIRKEELKFKKEQLQSGASGEAELPKLFEALKDGGAAK